MITTRRAVGPFLLTAGLLASGLLSGCAEDQPVAPGSGVATPTPTAPADGTDDGASTPPTAGNGEATAAPFPADTEPDTAEPSADALVSVTDIRIGRHDGFDRVVLEVDGRGIPGWDTRYVDQAREQGSGFLVELAGDGVLEITLTGVGYPFDTGVEEYSGPRRLASADTEVVTEVVWDSTYEGSSVAFVGTDSTMPFRVYSLDDPVRVVLEVAHRR